MIRKIVVVLIAVFVIAAIALAVFIATFNANKYRPLVVEKLEDALGKSVQLERINLTWEKGIAVELKNLVIFEGTEPVGDPLLTLDSARAVLELLPLLNRQFNIGAVILKEPSIRLIRNLDGRIRGLDSFAKKQTSPSGVPALPLLFIREISVEDGVIRYRDESAPQPLELTVRRTNISVKDLRLNAPIPFKVSAALFGDAENLAVKGNLRINPASGVVSLEGLLLKSDLGSLRSAELINAIPALGAGTQVDDFGGKLEIDVELLKLSNDWLKDLQMEVHLAEGWIKIADLKNPIEGINAEVIAGGGQTELKSLSAQFAGGTVAASGILRNLSAPQPSSSFKLSIRNLNLAELAASQSPEEPAFHGILSFVFDGAAVGLSGPIFLQSLIGEGQIEIQEGVLRNVNFVREVFQKLSILPGVVRTLEERLPPSYKEKLQARDTVFNPMVLPFVIKNGFLVFDQLAVVTDSFELTGMGQMNPTGILGAQVILRLDPDMSQAFIRSLAELQYLTDRQGRLEIPLTIQGPVSGLHIVPNLQVIGSRLALSKTSELIGGWLGGNKSASTAQPGGSTDSQIPQKSKPTTPQDILSLFLGPPQSKQESVSQTGNQ